MKTVAVNHIRNLVGSSFFSIHGYAKTNGEVVNMNAQMGVKRNLKGGTWNGKPGIHTLIHKPCHYRNQDKVAAYNGYRTLINTSLIGATIKFKGESYLITR